MDQVFVADGDAYVGREFDFMIKQLRGRDIVLSRLELLAAQAELQLEALEKAMENKETLQGRVKEVRDFGAMVEVQGVVGMVHISELSWARVERTADVVRVGDPLSVRVLSIEPSNVKNRPPRIGLSAKAAEGDPWEKIDQHVKVGGSYAGKVLRLERFGAFVEVVPGVDGLIHVSRNVLGKSASSTHARSCK